ncbi:hypothetical protein [Desulfohalovibrio reitneri]|nr:hypothetical protein [Desulfohalovibrio reitneri]
MRNRSLCAAALVLVAALLAAAPGAPRSNEARERPWRPAPYSSK